MDKVYKSVNVILNQDNESTNYPRLSIRCCPKTQRKPEDRKKAYTKRLHHKSMVEIKMEYRYYNNQVRSHQQFKDKVKSLLSNNKGEWFKTPEIQEQITGGKHRGWNEPKNQKDGSKGWSSEWTRNILYDIRKYLDENESSFESDKEKGPGQDHWRWRMN